MINNNNNNNIHTSLASMEVAATDNSYRRLLLLLLLLLCSKLFQAVKTAVHQLMLVDHNLQVEGVANLVLLPRNYILFLLCTLEGLLKKIYFS